MATSRQFIVNVVMDYSDWNSFFQAWRFLHLFYEGSNIHVKACKAQLDSFNRYQIFGVSVNVILNSKKAETKMRPN